VLHYGKPGTGIELHTGIDVYHRTHDQRGRRDVRAAAGRLDGGHQGSVVVGAVEHTILVTDTGFEVLTLSANADLPAAAAAS